MADSASWKKEPYMVTSTFLKKEVAAWQSAIFLVLWYYFKRYEMLSQYFALIIWKWFSFLLAGICLRGLMILFCQQNT